MQPITDTEFQEHTITKVEPFSKGGYSLMLDDHTGIGFTAEDFGGHKAPEVGQKVRLYGKKFFPVRGLMIDGSMVFYRTEEEQKRHADEVTYGKDVADYLRRWDSADVLSSVWSVERGGIGPGYEQALQLAMIEMLRFLHTAKVELPLSDDPDSWNAVRQRISDGVEIRLRPLGLSGAQWGMAMQLAVSIYQEGPLPFFTKLRDRIKSGESPVRMILISRAWPRLED